MASLLRIVLIQTAFLVLLVSSQDTDDAMMITGVLGGSVTLDCDLELSDPPELTWRDRVYNTDRNPALIFTTEDNTNMAFNENHLNKDSYAINDEYSLEIKDLKEDDVGLYFCESVINGETLKKKYNLNIGSTPECSGETSLMEGEKTVLSCSAKMIGNGLNPKMEFYANDELAEFTDETEIGEVKIVANIDGTWDQDKVKYTCKLAVGTLKEECSLTVSVKYLMRNLEITPKKTDYVVGDKLKCMASGNPAPSMSWSPEGDSVEEGEGWKRIVIKKEWEGKPTTLKCSGSNTLGGEKKMLSENITFTAGEAKKDSEAKPASGDGNQVAGIVAGLIIGAVVLVVIIIAIVCIRRKQNKKPKGSKPVPTKEDELRDHHNMDGKGGDHVELTKVEKQPALEAPPTTLVNHATEAPPTTAVNHATEAPPPKPKRDEIVDLEPRPENGEKEKLLWDDDDDDARDDVAIEVDDPPKNEADFQPRNEVDSEPEEFVKDPFGDYNHKVANNDTLPIRGPADDDDFVVDGNANNANQDKPNMIDTDDLDALLRDLQNSVP